MPGCPPSDSFLSGSTVGSISPFAPQPSYGIGYSFCPLCLECGRWRRRNAGRNCDRRNKCRWYACRIGTLFVARRHGDRLSRPWNLAGNNLHQPKRSTDEDRQRRKNNQRAVLLIFRHLDPARESAFLGRTGSHRFGLVFVLTPTKSTATRSFNLPTDSTRMEFLGLTGRSVKRLGILEEADIEQRRNGRSGVRCGRCQLR